MRPGWEGEIVGRIPICAVSEVETASRLDPLEIQEMIDARNLL